MPSGWSTAAQVRTSTEAAGSVLGRSDQLPSSSAIVVGDLVVEEDAHAVYRNGSPIDLTHREFLLLTMLARHPNRVLTHHTILTAIWGPHAAAQPEYLWVLVRQLRKRLEPDPSHPRYLVSEPWVGYRFVVDTD